MGLFDFIFGSGTPSRVEVLSDRVWMSQQAKFNGIRRELDTESATDRIAIVLIAHFPDTLAELDFVAANYHGNVPMTSTLAETLSTMIATRLKLNDTSTIDLVVAERHPRLDIDDEVLEFAKTLPCRCRLSHHLSLEDPLLKAFAGGWVGGVLKSLGMADEESIESDLVSRSVRRAQKKIRSSVLGNSRAKSAADWMERNMSSSGKM